MTRARAEDGLPDVAAAVAALAALEARGWRAATAESCTGGLVTALLTAVPGSSRHVLGGIVAYADAVKTGQLGVPRDILAHHGAVSAATAMAMAEGARERLGADVAVAVTGIAGPGGDSSGTPVGRVWIGLATRDGSHATRHDFAGDRHAVRTEAARAALDALADAARQR